VCCFRVNTISKCSRLTKNLKNKAIALQKTSKIKRSLLWKGERSLYRKPQKQGDTYGELR
ncbi:MAG: hypothetical protein V7K68_00915, partial [Nostoc sp.]|uniref:hypothetical protein n=1 Tax=Nostoc sp. TaxID=1180 RepID=UPI002FFA1BBA